MLVIPSNSERQTCIVGIDPGSETLGCATLHFDVVTLEITQVEARTFYGSKLHRSKWMMETQSDRLSRIHAHQVNLVNLFNDTNPIAIVCESPFISMRMPQAYGALTEVVCAVRSAVHAYDVWRPLYMVDPPTAKRAVGGKGNATKEEVKQAICLIPALMNAIRFDLNTLDEHSIDAIAIAYYQYLLYQQSKMPYI